MAIAGIGQNYYQNNVETGRAGKAGRKERRQAV